MNSLRIALNIIKRTLGKGRFIFVFVIVPALLIALIISLSGTMSKTGPKVSYAIEDRGPLGVMLVSDIEHGGVLSLKQAETGEELKNRVREGKTESGFTIPADFSEKLLAGQPPHVEIFQYRTSDETALVRLDLEQRLRGFTLYAELLHTSGISGLDFQDKLQELLDQARQKQVSAVEKDLKLTVDQGTTRAMGLFLIFVMGLMGTSINILLEDRRNRTMERMYAAPVRAYEIALGNFLGSFALGTLQIGMVLFFSAGILGHDFKMPLGLQFLLLECFLLVSVGIASALGGLIRQHNLVATINSLVITPTCMLGGCFWPVEVMPDFMQKLSNFVPQKWVISGLDTLSRGGGLADISVNIGILLLFAAILLGFGSVVLKPSDSEMI